jgi:hypothetical protein
MVASWLAHLRNRVMFVSVECRRNAGITHKNGKARRVPTCGFRLRVRNADVGFYGGFAFIQISGSDRELARKLSKPLLRPRRVSI